MNIVAERIFHRSDGVKIFLSIGCPFATSGYSGSYTCEYRISYENSSIRRTVEGVDAIQSILLTLAAAEKWLTDSKISDAGEVSWEGGVHEGDLGLRPITLD